MAAVQMGRTVTGFQCSLCAATHISQYTAKCIVSHTTITMSAVHKPYAHLPFGETGHGVYGKLLLEECTSYLDPARPKMLKLVEEELATVDQKTFTIGDYGCADASISVQHIRAIIDIVRRERGDSIPITVIYEDQVSNDFQSVFNRLYGNLDHPRSYLPDYENVYAFATAASFYDQCVPDGSLDVIMALLAPHWLPTRPTVYRESIYRYPDASEEERALVAAEAAKAWERFLLHRAKELKPGGLLFVSTPCEDPDRGPDQAYMKKEDLVCSMIKVWKHYKTEGKITEQEFIEANFDCCERTKDEFIAPFSDNDSLVAKAGLKLLGVDVYHIESIFKKKWRETNDTADDRMMHAQNYVTANRPWSNTAFVSALSSSRTDQEKNDLVDCFFADVIKDLGQRSPADLQTDMIIGYVFIQKDF